MIQRHNCQTGRTEQGTHSDENAAYGTRTIELRDRWLTFDSSKPSTPENQPAACRIRSTPAA